MNAADPTHRTQRATENRPREAQAIRAAIHELRSQGLGDYVIANAMASSVEFVRGVLGERPQQETA